MTVDPPPVEGVDQAPTATQEPGSDNSQQQQAPDPAATRGRGHKAAAYAKHTDDRYAWAMVGVPFAVALAQMVSGFNEGLFIVLGLLAVAVNLALAIRDMDGNPTIEFHSHRRPMLIAAALLSPL
ncbi:hypothetical protein [Egibacter rhizosphaerae]|uniref:hypothetical protein n=1 Tax=Egibacter rhizosphaerae TaxID=1670831 RepID=UPI001F0D453F|nr:hypothetical protein [Egibacter rhizosphaerae]